MQNSTLWRTLLGVDKTIVEAVDLDVETGILVASVRPTASMRNRCGACRKSCPRYDAGDGRRRWRSLDAGAVQIQLEAAAPRVSCPVHGVTVAAVPWARHQSGHTLFFDQQVAWLATQTSKTAITVLMRIAWRTVGAIITRVWADTEQQYDQFAGLTRIGIDEISYKRGHKYLTCVVDHDSGRLVWAAPGQDKATLATFFDALGPERSAQITHVSADGAAWIASVVKERAPNAVRCADPFHVVKWATEALDDVRRASWNDARKAAQQNDARDRATTALRRLDHEGTAINYVTVATAAGVSRSLLYRDPELREEINRLLDHHSSAPRQAAAQRMSPTSQNELLASLRTEVQTLRNDNHGLRTRLAAILGEERDATRPTRP